MDAQRQELYSASFTPDGKPRPATDDATRIWAQADWLAGLRQGDLVTGSGLRPLKDRLPEFVSVADESLWQPTAEMTGRLAWQQYQAGVRHDLWKFVPQYHRRSAAEEKRDAAS